MSYPVMLRFFFFSTALNLGILLIWSIVFMMASDTIFQFHGRFYPLSREEFNMSMYILIGVFKIFFIFFNMVPLISLWMMHKKKLF